GLEMCFASREICFRDPQLPKFLDEVAINNLTLGASSVNLRLRRRGQNTEIAVVSRQGDVTIKIAQ
ncbi:MAG TPA: hypothetical protein VFQ52_06775, partial [Rhizomicrobium sp.]|nr:hypothetical protein [Rhizomicrobium sp.]